MPCLFQTTYIHPSPSFTNTHTELGSTAGIFGLQNCPTHVNSNAKKLLITANARKTAPRLLAEPLPVLVPKIIGKAISIAKKV